MKTSTRLILLLTLAVSPVMALVSFIALRQRAAALVQAALDEVRAHAVTLRIALEEDYATGRQLDAQRLINRLSESTGLYGVILFDERGEATAVSERLARAEIVDSQEAREVIASGRELPIRRRINNLEVLSLILPLQLGAQRRGALEISLSVEFVRMADNLAAQRSVADRAAEERLELERRLRHSERLAAVGHLAAGVAHEMGAPCK
jgi:hypothetical protein